MWWLSARPWMQPEGAAQNPTDPGGYLKLDSARSPGPTAETSNADSAHAVLLHSILSHAVLDKSGYVNTRTWANKRGKKKTNSICIQQLCNSHIPIPCSTPAVYRLTPFSCWNHLCYTPGIRKTSLVCASKHLCLMETSQGWIFLLVCKSKSDCAFRRALPTWYDIFSWLQVSLAYSKAHFRWEVL